MITSKPNTCRYCEWLWQKNCPFQTPEIKTERKIDDPACGQFMALQYVSEYKERRLIDQMVLVRRTENKKMKEPTKRSIEF
jgi:hypothetical protein